LGPGIVVLMVLRMDGCRCVECSVLRRKEEGKEEKSGGMGSLYRQIGLPTLPTKLRKQGYHYAGYVSFFADRPPRIPHNSNPIPLLSFLTSTEEDVKDEGEPFPRLRTRPAIVLFGNQLISHLRNHQSLA